MGRIVEDFEWAASYQAIPLAHADHAKRIRLLLHVEVDGSEPSRSCDYTLKVLGGFGSVLTRALGTDIDVSHNVDAVIEDTLYPSLTVEVAANDSSVFPDPFQDTGTLRVIYEV